MELAGFQQIRIRSKSISNCFYANNLYKEKIKVAGTA